MGGSIFHAKFNQVGLPYIYLRNVNITIMPKKYFIEIE